MNQDQLLLVRQEAVKWVLSILGALAVYAIVAAITLSVYHPDIDQLNKTASDILAEAWQAVPEPMEAMLFRLGVITILPALCGFYVLLSRSTLPGKLAAPAPFLTLSSLFAAAIAIMVIYDLCAQNNSDNTSRNIPVGANGEGNTNFSFYFQDFFLGNYFWLYTLVIVPVVCYLFFKHAAIMQWRYYIKARTAAIYAAYLLLAGVIVCITAMNTFSFPYSVENRYDLAAVYYSVTQVFAGLPMLVDGFTNTYGLYPHFLVPLFKITGLNVGIFSFTMSLLLTVCFALNFYVLNKFTRSKAIMLCGFATMLFFGYLNRKLATHFDNYFALFPIRYLIPSVLLVLATWYLAAPSTRRYWITTFIMAAFILWNPEIGISCFIAWVVMNIHRDYNNAQGRIAWNAVAAHMAKNFAAAFMVFYTFKLIIWLCYGTVPDLSLLFSTASLFSAVGFGLLPMDVVHPWNIMALIIFGGTIFSIAVWHKKAVTAKSSIILLLTLISLGYLAYFQGRSHSAHLSSAMPFSILLLTLLGDELWTVVANTPERFFSVLFVIFLFFMSFSFIELVYNAPGIVAMITQEDDKAKFGELVQYLASDKETVENNSQEHEKIIVLTQKKNQPLMFDGNKRLSAFHPGLIDLFLKKDVERLERLVADSSFTVFLESGEEHYPFLQKTYGTIGARYEYVAIGARLVALKPRKRHIPDSSFLNRPEGQILYKKYYDNAASYSARADDAFGIPAVSLGSSYSVEALFFNTPQMFPEAIVVGNASSHSGFAIGHMYNAPRYFFNVNDFVFVTTVPNNKWIYFCMNVFPDHMDVYINGVRMPRQQLKEVPRDTDVKLSIGNLSGDAKPRYFVGAISEVRISHNVMDSSMVAATWSSIKQIVH